MQLPVKITPCPITEAIIEVRFEPAVERDAVFGILYQKINQFYTQPAKKLPLFEFLPEQIRDSDPNFKNQPYYKFERDNFILQLGPNVLAVSVIKEYPGWEILKSEFLRAFSLLAENNVVKEYNRLALRYINQLEGDATPSMQLKIMIGERDITKLPFNITTQIAEERLDATIRYRNDATGTKGEKMSIIDVDAVLRGPIENFQDKIEESLDIIHLSEKGIFFSALKPEFVKTLNPIYAAV